MKLLSLLGLDAWLRRLRYGVIEGASAMEDRVQLLRMAWQQDKQRLKLLCFLTFAVMALAILALAMLSAATVVHFWDSPQRVVAAWSVAGFWSLLWAAAMVWLWTLLQRGSTAFDPIRREFSRDWEWLEAQLGLPQDREPQQSREPREPRPRTPEALLTRIDRQRRRMAARSSTDSAAAGETAAGGVLGGAAVVELARAHPVMAGVAAAGVVAVVGPRRLIRWAGWLLPLLFRSRS